MADDSMLDPGEEEAVALVGVAAFLMAVEGVQVLRDHVPSHLGVPVAGVASRRPAA